MVWLFTSLRDAVGARPVSPATAWVAAKARCMEAGSPA